MSAKVIGTLNDFIDVHPPASGISSLLDKLPFHKNSTSCGKRVKTSIHDYIASKKKTAKIEPDCEPLLRKAISQRYCSDGQTKIEQELSRREKHIVHNISTFKKDAYVGAYLSKVRPKMEESLLRALSKIQRLECVSDESRNCEEALGRLPQFSNVKLAPFRFPSSRSERLCQAEHPRLRQATAKMRSESISPEKRLEYERCLAWARKHNKDPRHYQIELGKLKSEETLGQNSQRRRKLLQKIKSGSLSRLTHNVSFH